MKHTAFRYDFTFRELIYFLFAKKKCPHCGGKLDKHKDFETVDGGVFQSSSNPLFFIQDNKVKRYVYSYSCKNCGRLYSLRDLSKK